MDWVADAVAELATHPGGASSAAHHRLRSLRRRLRPCAATPYRSSRRRSTRRRQQATGVADPRAPHRGRRGRPRKARGVRRQRPAGHHARPRRADVPAPLRCQGRRARRRLHHQRQRVPGGVRPARCGCDDQRDRRCTRPASGRICETSAPRAASRFIRVRWSAEHAARHVSPTRSWTGPVTTPPPPSSHATCCSSAVAGIRRCTCSARPAASCATTTPSARSCPANHSTRSASSARPTACSTYRDACEAAGEAAASAVAALGFSAESEPVAGES